MKLELFFRQCADDSWDIGYKVAKLLYQQGYTFTTRLFNATDIPELETESFIESRQPAALLKIGSLCSSLVTQMVHWEPKAVYLFTDNLKVSIGSI